MIALPFVHYAGVPPDSSAKFSEHQPYVLSVCCVTVRAALGNRGADLPAVSLTCQRTFQCNSSTLQQQFFEEVFKPISWLYFCTMEQYLILMRKYSSPMQKSTTVITLLARTGFQTQMASIRPADVGSCPNSHAVQCTVRAGCCSLPRTVRCCRFRNIFAANAVVPQ